MATNEVTPNNATNYLVITDNEQNQVIVNQPNTNTVQVTLPPNSNSVTQQENITVINDPSLKQVNITDQSLKVIQLTTLGPQGAQGPQGIPGPTGSLSSPNSGSFVITGSLIITGSSNITELTASNAIISGNVVVLGTASINTLVVNQTQLSTGSNQLGDSINDTQTLYGSVRIPTGSLTVTGSLNVSGSILQNGGSLAVQDGTVLYHISKWFTPSSTVSNTGASVTSVGTQFTSEMVGAKLTISGESRIITVFTSSTQVTVNSVYSVNYSGIAAGSWGVFRKCVQINSNGTLAFTFANGGWDITDYGAINLTDVIRVPKIINGYAENVGFGVQSHVNGLSLGNAYQVQWASGSTIDTTKDLGLRRNSAGVLEIYDGITADGTLTNRRDLLVRNITGSAATFTGNVGIGTTNPSSALVVKGSGTTSATTALTIQNANASSSLVVLDNGNVGMGISTPSASLHVNGLQILQGTTASDTSPLGSELAAVTGTGTNWTLAGTNLNVGGYTHATGSTTALTTTLAAVSSTYYQIIPTITGRTAGSVTVAYGGISLTTSATTTTAQVATSPVVLTITPTTDFDGTVVLSIKTVGTSSATTTFSNSSGSANIEVRASDAITNTFIGLNSGRRNISGVGASLTFFGSNAGANNTTGVGNTFIGTNAGLNNTIGQNNAFIGLNAGNSNTTGVNNIFIGQGTGQANTTGGQNIAIGQQSFGSSTTNTGVTAIGHNSLQLSTGAGNTAVGNQTLLFIVSGANNVAFGSTTGRYYGGGTVNSLTQIDNSILLGQNASPLGNAQTNQIVIGYQAVGLGSNTTVLGNSSTTFTSIPAGSLGVNTTSSAGFTLNISGSGNFTNNLTVTGSLNVSNTILQNGSALALQDGTILYSPTRAFTPTGTISTSGTTVTTVGSNFSSDVVGMKLTISGESRIITVYTSATQVTVASAYSVNYSAVAIGSWGVYYKTFEVKSDGYPYFYLGNQSGGAPPGTVFIYNSGGFPTTQYGFQVPNSLLLNGSGLSYANSCVIKWSSTTSYSEFGTTTNDLGIRRNSAGLLEIYNGITADGTVTNRRDLLVRNITGSTATFNGSITAASLLAQGVYFNNTLVAAANGDVLVGLDIAPTFTNGGFTGVQQENLVVRGGTNPLIRFKNAAGTTIWGQFGANATELSFNAQAGSLNFVAGNTQALYIFTATRNVLIQNGGAFIDNGYRLDISGSARITNDLTVTGSLNVSGSIYNNGVNIQALAIAYAIALG